MQVEGCEFVVGQIAGYELVNPTARTVEYLYCATPRRASFCAVVIALTPQKPFPLPVFLVNLLIVAIRGRTRNRDLTGRARQDVV
jgi:hypothetical protein